MPFFAELLLLMGVLEAAAGLAERGSVIIPAPYGGGDDDGVPFAVFGGVPGGGAEDPPRFCRVEEEVVVIVPPGEITIC